MIAVLRQRNFALLWTAGLISLIGDWAFYAAMPIFILDRTGSAFQSGLVWAAIVLPGVFIGPFAGVYVDRWDRRRIMLWGNVVQALAASCLLLVGSSRGVWVAMAVLLVQASLYAIYSPAESALLPTLVADEYLVTANALNSLNDNIGRVCGPLFGALLYAWFGIRGIALGNMISFASSALLVGMVVVTVKARPAVVSDLVEPAPESIWQSLRVGTGVVWHNRMLRALFLIIGLVALADGPLTAMLAPFIRQTLDRSAADFGTFLSFRGIAGILGGLVIAHTARYFREDRLLVACLLFIGIEVAIFAVVQSYVLTIILMMLAGPAIIGQTAMITTMLQRNSADAFRGRMFSLVGAFWGVISLISIVLGSAATSFFSPAEIMFGSGILYVGAGVGAVILLAKPASRGAGVDVAPISGSDENPAPNV
jgi:MFS family permease